MQVEAPFQPPMSPCPAAAPRPASQRFATRSTPGLIVLALVSLLVLELASQLSQGDAQRRLASDGCESADGADASDHTSGAFEPVTFFILAYLSSAVAQQVSLLLPKRIRVPHSVCLYLSGLALAWLALKVPDTEFGRAVRDIMSIDPHVIFWVLLPALLFEDSAGVHWHVFRRVCPNALLLAVPGVILNTVLTGLFVKVAFREVTWTWSTAMLLGSVLSATDPVAVVGALHSLSAPDKLASLISGESLFNDGSAVVLFNLFLDLARGTRELDMGYGFLFFVRMALGGPLLGLLFSALAYAWLRRTERFEIEVLVLLVTIHALFFVAEHPVVHVSGVLAVVCFGCFMASTGKYALGIEGEHEHHAVMSFLALLSNEAIFVVAGTVSYGFGRIRSDISVRDYLECAALYIVIHITRAVVILIFWPLLSTSGYGLNWREAVICLWGGLRGAVGLAMALLVNSDELLEPRVRERVAFHTSGIVFFTLLVNGTTVTTVYKRLRIYGKAEHHDRLLELALRRVDDAVSRQALNLREHWFFHNCHFDLAQQLLPALSSARPTRTKSSRLSVSVGDVDSVVDLLAQRLRASEAAARIAEKILCCSKRRLSQSSVNCFLMDTNINAEAHVDEEFGLALRLLGRDANTDEAEEWSEIERLLVLLRAPQQSAPTDGTASRDCCSSRETAKDRGGGSKMAALFRPRTPNNDPPSLQDALGVLPGAVPSPSPSAALPEEALSVAHERRRWQAELAAHRWRWAKCRVLRTLRMMRQLRKESGSLRFARSAHSRTNISAGVSAARLLEQCCSEDTASMMEVFQTIVNASRATYKSMFESQVLSAEPYRILLESLNVQEEAVGTSRGDNGFAQAWGYVRSTLGQPLGYAFWLATRVFRVDGWLDAQWWLLKRDAEVVTAYVMTQEHLIRALAIFSFSGFSKAVQTPMKSITEQAKRQTLFSLIREPYDGAMLVLFEHVLLARLLVRVQWQLVEQLQKEGALPKQDAQSIIRHVIRPTEKALFEFVPTPEQLRRIGSTRTEDYVNTRFKRWLMQLVRRLEFHDHE